MYTIHLSSLECVQSLTAINAPMVSATVSCWSLLSLPKWLSAYTGIKAAPPLKWKGKGTSLWIGGSLIFLMQVRLLDLCSGPSSRWVKTASTSKPKFTFTKLKKKENRLHSSATPPPLVVLREKKVHILMSGWIPYILKQNLHLKKGYKCKKNTANYVKTAVFH